MKKFLCFGVLLAALVATVGCDNKPTTAPTKANPSGTPPASTSSK